MKRRSFLSLLGMAAAAAPLARLLPAAIAPTALPVGIVATNAVPEMAANPIHVGMRGVPYFVNDTGNYFGISRSDVVPMPEWWDESKDEGSGDPGFYCSLPKDRSLIPADYRKGQQS